MSDTRTYSWKKPHKVDGHGRKIKINLIYLLINTHEERDEHHFNK